MIIFLYGSDAYRLKQAKEEIINRYKNKYPSGMSLFRMDMSETADSDILERTLKSPSFFNEHKLVICTNVFSRKTSAELITEKLKEHGLPEAADITLAVVENMSGKELNTKHKELFEMLADIKNRVREIEFLQGNDLADWIRNEVKSHGCSIEASALRNLVEIVGNESWAIVNELNKLMAYKDKMEITSADIRTLIPNKTENNVFKFLDALSSGNTKEALALLYRELHMNSDPHQILGAIIYQVRNMLIVKDLTQRGLSALEISKKAGIHPFVARKIAGQAGKFHPEKLKLMYGKILELEISSKRGGANIHDSLYKFLNF